MRIPLGFWEPEPGESDDEFNERVYREMVAAVARLKGRQVQAADAEAVPEVTPESGGAA